MKTLLFTLTMALIAFGAFGATKSYAHCGVCEASEKAHEMKKKPCTKCLEKKKPCTKCMEKGRSTPCSKCMKCAEKNKEKPCKICEQSERKWKSKKSMMDHSAKGSLTIRSGSPEAGRYN